jgi:hypothetical protein
MGSLADRLVRDTQYRTDDDIRRRKIESARRSIYKDHYNVNSGPVEAELKPTSLVPAQVSATCPVVSPEVNTLAERDNLKNAFSDRLSQLGFDLFRMVSVDILHEVEIGVWKSLFIHLL